MSNLSEKWEISNLGKYGSCIRGVSYKPKDIREEYSDDTVCILRSNNIKDNRINYNEVVYVDKKLVSDNQKLKENDIAICMSNGSKQLVGKNGIYSKNKMLTSIGAFCALFRSNEFVEPRFTKMLFESYSYKKQIDILLAGTSINNLKNSDIESLIFSFPPLEEQKKIADILSTVDKKIAFVEENINATEELKKGLMQKLLTEGIGHTEFKDSELGRIPESWEVVQLNDIFERVTRKNQESNDNALTISAQLGLVNQKKYFNKVVASKDLSNYYLLLKGEFAYNKSYSAGYPMGVIKRLDNYEKGVLSTLYICFRIKSSNIDTDYVLQYFSAGNFDKELSSIAQEGARNHGLLNVGVKEFFNLRMILPCMEEQKKIAEILSTVDKKLENLKEKKESFEELKKGLMQKLLTGQVRV